MRRGFKTQAEELSAELRGELNLTRHERLECTKLAAHLCIPVDPVTVLLACGASLDALDCVIARDGDFSAMTQYRGSRCRIFYNPNHSRARTANSLAHELSHVVLEHEPGPAIAPDGTRNFDPEQEEEAEWQAGALLVPRETGFALAGGRRQHDRGRSALRGERRAVLLARKPDRRREAAELPRTPRRLTRYYRRWPRQGLSDVASGADFPLSGGLVRVKPGMLMANQ
jgi:hypothetical protein